MIWIIRYLIHMSPLWKFEVKLKSFHCELEAGLTVTFRAPLEASFLLYNSVNILVQFLQAAHLLFFFEMRDGMSSNLEFSY